MATRMQQRRGTETQWTTANPILNIGEIGFESDTNKFKIGDGVNHWDDLPYFLDADSIGTSLDGYIPDTLLGAPNGVAQLNSSGKLVSDQIPNVDEITQDAINAALVAGTGLDKTYNDNANTITIDIDSTVATKTFAAELLTGATKTNITITGDENGLIISAENGVADSTTDNLTEGSTNKYFTDERAQDAVGNAVGTGLTYTDSTGAISVTANTYDAYGSAATVAGDLSTHSSDTTSVHGITDTSLLVTTTGTQTLTNKTLTNPTVSAIVSGGSTPEVVTAATTFANIGTVGYSNVPSGSVRVMYSETPAMSGNSIYVATDTLTNVPATMTFHDYGGGSFAGTLSGTFSSNTVDFAATDGAAFDAAITAAYGAYSYNENMVEFVFNSGNNIPSTVTKTISSTELSYLDGVTSAIQTQLDAKQAVVSGVSSTEIGYLDGVTSAIQTQLNAKAPVDDATFTGITSVDDLEIAGSLTFSGTATQINSTETTLEDPIIYLAEGNTANINDLGFVASYDDGTYAHTGLVKDASAGAWKLFKGVTDEPTNTVNFGQGTLDDLQVGGLTASSLTVGDVSNTEFSYLNGVTSNIQTQLDAKAPLSSPVLVTPDLKGRVEIIEDDSNGLPYNPPVLDIGGRLTLSTSGITFEGNTADSYETAISVVDPTEDRTIEFPDASGTVALTSDLSSKQDVVAGVSSTEIGYLNGVTSSIQTQLDEIIPALSASTTFTLSGQVDKDEMIGPDLYFTNLSPTDSSNLSTIPIGTTVTFTGDNYGMGVDTLTIVTTGTFSNGSLAGTFSIDTPYMFRVTAGAEVSIPGESNSGKYLTNDGTDLSWGTISVPTPTLHSVFAMI